MNFEKIREERELARKKIEQARLKNEQQIELIISQGQEISEGIATLIDLTSSLENILKQIKDNLKGEK